MKELVMFLLVNLKSFGTLQSVNMYDSTFSNIKYETEDSTYEITLSRKDKVKGEDENAN